MPPKTRLDPVVKLRERDEREARLRLAEGIRETAAARQRLHDARLRLAAAAPPGAGPAALYAAAEAARARALREVQRWAGEVDRAVAREEQLRKAYLAAHRAAEALRRVREARREEWVAEEARRERRRFDELAARTVRTPPEEGEPGDGSRG
jgi:flagellar export protein FliJ